MQPAPESRKFPQSLLAFDVISGIMHDPRYYILPPPPLFFSGLMSSFIIPFVKSTEEESNVRLHVTAPLRLGGNSKIGMATEGCCLYLKIPLPAPNKAFTEAPQKARFLSCQKRAFQVLELCSLLRQAPGTSAPRGISSAFAAPAPSGQHPLSLG